MTAALPKGHRAGLEEMWAKEEVNKSMVSPACHSDKSFNHSLLGSCEVLMVTTVPQSQVTAEVFKYARGKQQPCSCRRLTGVGA